MTVARTGLASPVVQWAGAALGVVAVAVGAYFVSEELSDDAAPAAVTQDAQPVSFPSEDAIGRFASSTDYQSTRQEQDAISRFAASSDYARAVREQDAILRLSAANPSTAFDVRDQDAILRTAVAADPATEDAILRLGPVDAGSPAGPEDAILRLRDGNGPTNTEDAITRMAAN
jgi:hypothetical protein